MTTQERSVFPALLGNDRLKRTLSYDFAAGRSAHAYILEGPDGSGKHTAARQIAASVLCERRTDPSVPLPCGTCSACRKILRGLSVDVLSVSNNGKATIGVDAIRTIRESLYITPNDGDVKFYIIENAHLMTVQAQNALLLSLEEPPPYVMFLLLCTDATVLLETIRSRAPVIRMERFQPDRLEEILTEQTGSRDRDRITAAAHLANGAIGQALALFESGEAERKRYDTAREFVDLLLGGRKSEAIAYALTRLPKERQDTREIIQLAESAVRDLIAVKKGAPPLFYANADAIPQAARSVSVRSLADLCDALARADADLAANCSQSTVMAALVTGR